MGKFSKRCKRIELMPDLKNCLFVLYLPRRDIPIGVSLYSTPTGTAYIEPLVESQKSTRTAKKGNTVLS